MGEETDGQMNRRTDRWSDRQKKGRERWEDREEEVGQREDRQTDVWTRGQTNRRTD